MHPDLIVPVAMFLFQFMGIDHFLSNQFMRWPIKSPNYFHTIDHTIWMWNWSPGGKLLNSAVVTGVICLTESPALAGLVCAGIILLKAWSAVRMYMLLPPEARW